MRPLLFCFLALTTAHLAVAADDFPLTNDSKPQEGVAKGTMVKDTYAAGQTSVFPGTEREYQLYLPAGFDKSKPTAFMVFQDGVVYQAPTAFDNLISRKEIPALVGVFVKPGVVPAANENALPRYNRSYEYDSVTDAYARFLIGELLPAIEKKHGIQFSTDPNEAAISGNSSGGICAFMVAWHRPDRFRRVFTGVGTYVGIHGADRLAVLVRKTEPKPLRVFLQSGTNDNNIYCGDWWMANQMMERSLGWAGYEVNHAWGEGGHNQKQASQIFPDVLRWLWKDWQTEKTVKVNARGESKWKGYEVCVENTEWEKVAGKGAAALDVQKDGTVTRTDKTRARTERSDGLALSKVSGEAAKKIGKGRAAWSPDQTLLYVSQEDSNRVVCLQVDGKGAAASAQDFVLLESEDDGRTEAKGLCVDAEGRIYVATSLGIQVCDQAGRVNFIIPTPQQPSDVCFGGKDFSELFVACGDALYKRSSKIHGVLSSLPPIKPPAPKL